MVSDLLPRWHSPSPPPHHGHPFRLCGAFLCFRNGLFGTAIFSAVVLVCLICYVTLLTPHDHSLFRPSAWNGISQHPNPVYASTSSPSSSAFPSPAPSVATPSTPDELTLEQIRDIVTPTRGFYSRDYSVHLGWNNVGVHGSQI